MNRARMFLLRLSAVALVTLASSVAAADTKIAFDHVGPLPADWASGTTGKGIAKWDVIADGSAPSKHAVLRQSGEATFCWAVRVNERISNGFVEVKLKPLAGREDQAGGIVFRFQDANNYYIVRANALEGNVVAYKTVNGRRASLPVKGRMFGYGVDTEVPKNRWSTLRVEFSGALFTVSFQGKTLFQVQDDTFGDAGAIGLWTKADSVTLFDDFTFGASAVR